jgi:hypothetical protein
VGNGTHTVATVPYTRRTLALECAAEQIDALLHALEGETCARTSFARVEAHAIVLHCELQASAELSKA